MRKETAVKIINLLLDGYRDGKLSEEDVISGIEIATVKASLSQVEFSLKDSKGSDWLMYTRHFLVRHEPETEEEENEGVYYAWYESKGCTFSDVTYINDVDQISDEEKAKYEKAASAT